MSWIPVVDISQHQGAVNFATMRGRGIRRLILRATHGTTRDARMAGYWTSARAAGYAPWEIGFYSFINPKRGSAEATARATAEFIRAVVDATDVLYMLDVESYRAEPPNAGTVTLVGRAFADYLREHAETFQAAMPGCRIIGYTNRAFWNSAEGPQDSTLAAELDWLVPRYPIYSTAGYDAVGYPPDPSRWDEWAFARASGPFPPLGGKWDGWQFSAGFNRQGPRYGCQSSDLDLNIVAGDAAARWFLEPAQPVPTPDPITPQEPDVLVPHTGVRIMASTKILKDTPTRVAAAPGTPANATGVAVNITSNGSLRPGFARCWSGVGPAPLISPINWPASAEPRNGSQIVELEAGGFTVLASEEVNLIVDQVGYTMPPVVGPKGDKGDPGPRGIQGVQGVKGDQGPPGPSADEATIVGTIVRKLGGTHAG